MKNKIFYFTLMALLFSFSSTQAHDLWGNAHLKADSTLEAEIGYGHDFPNAETIPEVRTHLFEPLKLMGKDFQANLCQFSSPQVSSLSMVSCTKQFDWPGQKDWYKCGGCHGGATG